MTEIRFYHLLQQKPLTTLVSLIERARGRDQVILIKAADKAEAETIDTYLWSYQPQSFLPHSLDTDIYASHQKILITTGSDNTNQASTLFQINHEALNIPDHITLCCKIFDGHNEEGLLAARRDWKHLKDAGHTLSYWQQDENGKWEQKA